MFLPGLMAGLLAGLLVTAPLNRQASAPSKSDSTPLDVARLSPTELETLALDALTALHEKRGPAPIQELGAVTDSWDQPENPRQIRLGMKNVRRLLPLAKKLTLESLNEMLKATSLSREKHLVAAVHHVVLNPSLSNTAQVCEEDLSMIHISPDYAAYLTSDDEAMLMLGQELTHVAVRTGRLKHFIENVHEIARTTVNLEFNEEQKEELACDFTGAEVLRRYIALHPTAETNTERFSRAFGYEPLSERLAHAWQGFCATYNGDPGDAEHLSQDQTFRALLGLDPELKALIPDDAVSLRLCR
jgi:hypothetical protein